MLPESTVLGQLEFLEIYDYYDMPLLFSCTNRAGHIFIAVFVRETEEAYTWLYVPVSNDRFERIRDGEIDTRSAFANPEDEIVMEISIFRNAERQSEVIPVPANEIDENWLPPAGDYLEIEKSLHDEVIFTRPTWPVLTL